MMTKALLLPYFIMMYEVLNQMLLNQREMVNIRTTQQKIKSSIRSRKDSTDSLPQLISKNTLTNQVNQDLQVLTVHGGH